MRITKIFQISAAHYLPNHPKCGEIHGHNYKIEVTLEGKINSDTGMVKDFEEIKQAFEIVKQKLDHKTLNDIIEIPTAENIAVYIFNKLKPELRELTQITVWETGSAYAVYSE